MESDVRIGVETNNTPNHRFNGEISVFKLYDKVLTQSDITQNFESLRDRFSV